MKLSKKQLSFYKAWQKKRAHKLRIILVEGLLYWALPFSLFMVLFDQWDQRFYNVERIAIDFAIMFIIAATIGLIKAYYTFKNRDAEYLKLKQKNLL